MNLTKMKIHKPTVDVFEAFVDPGKIKYFWFSSSSARWECGKTITLEYAEYNAQLQIEIGEIVENKKIVFRWGANGEGHTVTIFLRELDSINTVVEISEEGFTKDDDQLIMQMIDNKEGWVFMLVCLKAYLEFGITGLRGGLVKD